MLLFKSRIPVAIYPMFLFVAAIIGWLSSENILYTAIWMVVIFFSVLIHEYGHAFTAAAFGQKAQINLVALGGVTQRNGGRLPLWQEFLVVLNGPLAGFLLCGIIVLVDKYFSIENSALSYLLQVGYVVNFYWTLINLLPIQPLDGGQLLSIIMEGIFGFKGVKAALFLGVVIGVLISILLIITRHVVPAAIFMMLSYESYKTWRQALAMTDQDQNSSLKSLIEQAEEEIAANHPEMAVEKFKIIREIAKSGHLYRQASQKLALLLIQLNRKEEAYEILKPLSKQLDRNEMVTLQSLAFSLKQWQVVVEVGDRVFQIAPTPQAAMMNAVAHAALGRYQSMMGWLQCARREGAIDIKDKLKLPEFDAYRSNGNFQEFQASLTK